MPDAQEQGPRERAARAVVRRAVGTFAPGLFELLRSGPLDEGCLGLARRRYVPPLVARGFFGERLLLPRISPARLGRGIPNYLPLEDGKDAYSTALFSSFVWDGRWDLEAGPFDEQEKARRMRSLVEVVQRGGDFRDSAAYAELVAAAEARVPKRHRVLLHTRENIDAYCRSRIALIRDLARHGYRTRAEREGVGREIGVAIGRNGELLHARDGRHRAGAARALGLDEIVVEIRFVHLGFVREAARRYRGPVAFAVARALADVAADRF